MHRAGKTWKHTGDPSLFQQGAVRSAPSDNFIEIRDPLAVNQGLEVPPHSKTGRTWIRPGIQRIRLRPGFDRWRMRERHSFIHTALGPNNPPTPLSLPQWSLMQVYLVADHTRRIRRAHACPVTLQTYGYTDPLLRYGGDSFGQALKGRRGSGVSR